VSNVVFVLFRRMRAPLVVLVLTYAVAILGLTLIPGRDGDGDPWHMDFFHAFYVVSYTASTIGFGEIPHPFTPAQRLWMMAAIYMTVVGWLYAIGTLLGLFQDPAFRRVLSRHAFARAVRRMGEPFYLVSGYGENAALVVQSLATEGIRTVVVDADAERVETLKVTDLGVNVPGLCADPADPEVLRLAGLEHPQCAGVLAMNTDDQANLTVAISAKLLAPRRPVISRAAFHDTEANLASFGTEHILNPFDLFAERFALALRAPSLYLLYAWLTGTAREAEPPHPPQGGRWILCGFGRFGKAMQERLAFEGIRPVIIEAEPERTDAPQGTVVGRGTEAQTLREAGAEEAAGLIAGTDNDSNNLSILMTAREINPRLFTVARQWRAHNEPLFEAARPDLVMEPGVLLAREVRGLVLTPLLPELLAAAQGRDEAWANELLSRVAGATGQRSPTTWALRLGPSQTPAVYEALRAGQDVRLRHLMSDPRHREHGLPAVPLLLKRAGNTYLTPAAGTRLRRGDRLLFCGPPEAARHMAWSAEDAVLFHYIVTGEARPSGWLWQWLQRRSA
jgi:Trk K+ transport system NAD-binding subunit